MSGWEKILADEDEEKEDDELDDDEDNEDDELLDGTITPGVDNDEGCSIPASLRVERRLTIPQNNRDKSLSKHLLRAYCELAAIVCIVI